MDSLPPRLVLYDGVCGFCDRVVQWLLAHDREARFTFAPLQGPTAAAARAAHPEIPLSIDTVVFVDEGRAWLRSAAFVRLSRYLPAPWRALRFLGVVPAALLDVGYAIIARVRYRIFGKLDTCRIPTPAERARFRP
jgi:predicted DCC family thiol-disulfide oxidoreductase YuxK